MLDQSNVASQNQPVRPFGRDVFALPFLDGCILYVPHIGLVAGVEPRVGALVEDLKDGRAIAHDNLSRQWIDAFDAMGAFEPQEPIAYRRAEDFQPVDVTLLLTTRCSLRCVYCYACAGEQSEDIDQDTAFAAIRLVADNAVKRGEQEIRISFHGEGEPTYNWKLFSACIAYAKDQALKRGLNAWFSMSTNAMWGHAQRELIAESFQDLSVSLDGVAEVQNRQRPAPRGQATFDTVLANIRFLQERGVNFGLRATVMPDSVDAMSDFVRYVAEHLTCTVISFEPFSQTGRGEGLESEYAGFFKAFEQAFEDAEKVGAEHGISLTYSGCRPHVKAGNFCHATGPEPNFVVTTSGLVSSCYEIVNPKEPKGKFTVYGRYNPTSEQFEFDPQTLEGILNAHVNHLAHCRDCFARWHCSGDCLARAEVSFQGPSGWVGDGDAPRCQLNRDMTFKELLRLADFATGE